MPAAPAPRLLPLGDAAFTVEFGTLLAPEIHRRVLGFAAALAARKAAGQLPGVIEWVPTFRSLTVHFDPLAIDGDALGARLLALAAENHEAETSGRLWTLPVCFDEAVAPDLAAVAAACGITREAVIALLTGCDFTVYMLGFLPGFPYLGELPATLALPRRATPRAQVAAGSVAIAGRMAAVYPWPSPGGWHLVGRTPLQLFDAAKAAQPALFAPGDRVRWEAVGADVFDTA